LKGALGWLRSTKKNKFLPERKGHKKGGKLTQGWGEATKLFTHGTKMS